MIPRFRLLPLLLALLWSALSACSHPDQDTIFAISQQRPQHQPDTAASTPALWQGFRPGARYIAVFGDVQTYISTPEFMPLMAGSVQWLSEQKRAGAPIECALFTGDLTDDNSPNQWERFRALTTPLTTVIPTLCISGNHDYDWDRSGAHYNAIRSRASCHITTYTRTRLLHEHTLYAFHPDSVENLIFSSGIPGLDIIALEFAPRPQVVSWATEHVKAHPERKYLLLTHELLQENGDFCKEPWSFSTYQFTHHRIPYTSPQGVWEQLISDNDNIVAALCGHNGFSALNDTQMVNAAGRAVPIVMFNLQNQPRGGDGLIELWEFAEDSNEVNILILDTKSSTATPAFTITLPSR